MTLAGMPRRALGLQPFERLHPLSTREDPDLRMREVLGYPGSDLQKGGVRNGGNAINVAVVIVHELQMLNERAEAVPSGKGRCLDQQSGQLALLADVGVYRSGNFAEIFDRKAAFRLQNQHASSAEKFEPDHRAFPSSPTSSFFSVILARRGHLVGRSH